MEQSIYPLFRKNYADFTPSDWRQIKKIPEGMIPETLIIHCEDWDVPASVSRWKTLLSDSLVPINWYTSLGKLSGTPVVHSVVYGAPMAAQVAYQFANIGVKQILQTGYCGGISPALNYDEILIATEARGEDGVSQLYQPTDVPYGADPELVSRADEFCQKRRWAYRQGQVVTSSTMMLQSQNSVEEWQKHGLIAVEGECAAILAVANRFKIPALSLFSCSDQIWQSDNIYSYSDERDRLEETIQERIAEVVIALTTASQSS